MGAPQQEVKGDQKEGRLGRQFLLFLRDTLLKVILPKEQGQVAVVQKAERT